MAKTKYQPTEENRKKVKTLAGFGLKHEQICMLMGLRSPKTLRRYFSKELSLGIAESSINVLRTALTLASSRRDPGMTIFWLKTRARWSPGMTVNPEAERDEEVIYLYEDYKLPAAAEQAIEPESKDGSA
jgi:hypothetical protein